MIASRTEYWMPRLDNAIDIKAPRDKVFDYVSQVELQPEWVKWAKQVEILSTEPGHVGSTDFMLMQVGPKKDKVEGLITEYRDDYFVTRRLTKGMKMEERVSVVPYADGTKVAWSVEYVPPMGPIGKMIDFLFMVRLFDQLMKDSLNILKERLETARP
jgi:uncharacterized membrane protein